MPKPLSPLRKAAQTMHGVWTAPEKWAFRKGLRTPAGLTLPHFLGIGAQKAGTSWLYENLRCHPDLYLPDQKELHFWDRRYHRSLAFYSRKFTEGAAKVRGEITPAYSSLPAERVEYIHAVLPDLKILFLMRDPVARAWSHAQMHLLEKEAIRQYDEVPEERFFAHFQGEDSRGKGDYLGILETWGQYFPPEQIFLGYFEDITQRPTELLREVFRFLGVREDVELDAFPFRQVVNRGRKNPMPEKYRLYLEAMYAPAIERLHQRFGERVAHWRRTPGAG